MAAQIKQYAHKISMVHVDRGVRGDYSDSGDGSDWYDWGARGGQWCMHVDRGHRGD